MTTPHDMDAEDIEDVIVLALTEACEDEPEGTRYRVSTYKQDGILTRDPGVVLKVGRAEFQITIAQVKGPDK